MTALENAMLPAYPLGEAHGTLKRRAMELFDLFNLSRNAHSRVERLSGGETQRVAIVRALINNPPVIIADEPTAHLDTKLSKEFMEIVGGLKGERKTLLIASHDPLVYDSEVVDRVINIRTEGSRKLPHDLSPHCPLALCLIGSDQRHGLYASSYGIQILKRWDLRSGSEGQLILERKTYLVSTLLSTLLGVHLLSLFLFIFTADELHSLFVGAMCAAGSLYVNGYGYPALVLKMVNVILAGLWLILNTVDNRGTIIR